MSQNNTNSISNTPKARINCESITVSIWENEGNFGPMHSVQVQRSYQATDVEGKLQWYNTTSIPTGQLLAAAKALEAAWNWIMRRRQAWKAEQAAAQPADAPPAREPAPQAAPKPGEEMTTIRLPSGAAMNVPIDAAAYISALQEHCEALAEAGVRAASQPQRGNGQRVAA